MTIESEPHIIHVDDAGQFGPPGEGEEMAFFRDSEGNLVGLAGRRAAPKPCSCDLATRAVAGSHKFEVSGVVQPAP